MELDTQYQQVEEQTIQVTTITTDISTFLPKKEEFQGEYWDWEDWMKEGSMGAGFMASFLLNVASELGDKTWFIAAILAMKYSRALIYTGAMLALAFMTLLSTSMGYAAPYLLPKEVTNIIAVFLFMIFGLKLLYEAWTQKDEGPNEEMIEAEKEIAKKDCSIKCGDGSKDKDHSQFKLMKSKKKILFQAFTLTFFAEWGDRSQITTISIATVNHPFGVFIGGTLGHAVCTGLAVIGGKMLGEKIQERTMNLIGGVLFLFFAAYTFIMPN